MATKFVLGMGNPLLDISAVVDQAFLDKYGIKLNDQILAEEKHAPMYADLETSYKVEYIPGGATQNSIRIAQWMLGAKGSTAYMGCVGQDARASTMESIMSGLGVEARYQKEEATPTGTCAVCIVGGERSLVANLAAANNYKVDHCRANWDLVERAQICYSAGFFITASAASMVEVAQHAAAAGKTYAMNISAPFLCEVPPFKEAITKLLPYVDILFGNENEAGAFAKSEGWDATDVQEIAKRIAAIPSAEGKQPRMVVITQGADATVVAQSGAVQLFPVPPIPKERIVDTNGAGDAFVGGFLAQLARGLPLAECVRAGHWAAGVVIQRSGCTFPEKCEFA